MIGPAPEQRLEETGDGALARGDAAADADHVGNACGLVPQERLGHDPQVTGRGEPEVQEPSEREVDVFDLAQLERLVQAAQRADVGFREGERRRRPERAPLGAVEVDVRAQLGHRRTLVADQSVRARPMGQLTPVPPRPQ